jgi:thiol-disulfide isomerase/thioredoxin
MKIPFALLMLVGCSIPFACQASGRPALLPADAARIHSLVRGVPGRVTLVNVWATWCVPCRKEFPALLRVARAHRKEGLRLLLVSSDFSDQLPAARRFLAGQGVTDTSYIKHPDDQGFINDMDSSWTGTLPANFIYDEAGRLISFWEGESTPARFEREVWAALRKPRRSSQHPLKGKP